MNKNEKLRTKLHEAQIIASAFNSFAISRVLYTLQLREDFALLVIYSYEDHIFRNT